MPTSFFSKSSYSNTGGDGTESPELEEGNVMNIMIQREVAIVYYVYTLLCIS